MKYQYIGDKNQSPESIKFMDQVRFTLKGPYVDVTDPEVLKKLENHQCFKVKAEKKGAKKKAPKKQKVEE